MAKDNSRREEQIVEQARKLFSQAGYHGTSLQEIADELGITRPAFYYYFSSKDELLWRLIGNLGNQLLEEARPIVAEQGDPVAKLHKLMAAHTRTILANADAFKIYFAERHLVDRRRDRQLRRGEDQYVTLIEGIVAEGQNRGAFRGESPHLLALIVLGLANSTLRWFQTRRDLSMEEVSKLVADVAIAGVTKPGAARPSGKRAKHATPASA